MKTLLKSVVLAVLVSLIALTTGCSKQEPTDQIRVGVIAGPETQIMQVAQTVAKKQYNLDIKIVQFDDYTIPNAALASGSIDANVFQTIPYLDAAKKARGYDIVVIGKTFVYPMAFYSDKIKSIANLPMDATVAIANDPSNEARALFLLQKGGLIKLRADVTLLSASTQDIVENPKNLQFKLVNAAQLPRTLPDVTMAAINTNYAIVAGLLPSKNGILVEDKNVPYANVIAVMAKNKDNPKMLDLVKALHSPEVVAEANKLFKGQAIKAWD